jgi:hypothetical protein
MEVLKHPIEIHNPQIRKTRTMTTGPFRIDLICPCMGMNLFTNHKSSPAATRVMRTVVSGVKCSPVISQRDRSHGTTDKSGAFDSLSVGAIRKRRGVTPLHFYSS